MDYSFIIDNMTWSFSRLNSFKTCPYGWLKQYIKEEDRLSGYYGEYGEYIHRILEEYFKGQLDIFQLVTYYEENYYKNITSTPPPKPANLAEKYYEDGKRFLENFEFDFSKYQVLGVEKELNFNIDKYKFTGFIDLLLKDKETEKIIILDYKSSDPYKGKKTPDKNKIYEYSLQQYLYSYGLYKEIGIYPSELRLWFFRLNKIHKIDFNEDDMLSAIDWVRNEIYKISTETDWKPLSNYWFCNYLCSVRNGCEYKIYNKGQ